MIEKRYILAALAFFSTFNVYSIRNGITISIMDMAVIEKDSLAETNINDTPDQTVCPFVTNFTDRMEALNITKDKEITCSESQKSDILGAYFIGYRNVVKADRIWCLDMFHTTNKVSLKERSSTIAYFQGHIRSFIKKWINSSPNYGIFFHCDLVNLKHIDFKLKVKSQWPGPVDVLEQSKC